MFFVFVVTENAVAPMAEFVTDVVEDGVLALETYTNTLEKLVSDCSVVLMGEEFLGVSLGVCTNRVEF